MKINNQKISVVMPAKNEAIAIGTVIQKIRRAVDGAEILVVDDGSTDDTAAIAAAEGAKVLRHPYSKGNGAAIKTGARHASGDIVVFMDADGQHDPAQIMQLVARLQQGYDLVVGARGKGSQASLARAFGNALYNRLASWIVGQPVLDLTSGFRAVRADLFREFLSLLPNGFSYPTTSTMAFFRAGYSVAFEPILVSKRKAGGKSHISLLRDGSRFFLIIFKIGTLFSPLKIFAPISASLFTAACWYYAYTFITEGRFTNAGTLLFTTAILTFLIGLVSEQITQLIYMQQGSNKERDPARTQL